MQSTTVDVYTIFVHINVHPTPLLKIPVSDVLKYSSKPLKWIRYVTGVVLGTQGILLSLDGDHQDIDVETDNTTWRNLLFVEDRDIRFIDHDGLNHCKSSQFTTESRLGFRFAIEARDQFCVISDHIARLSDAAHLIPHSKGSGYLQRICCHRTNRNEPQIESINSVENGILITPTLHRLMDNARLGILRTPNFAMACEDVLPATNIQNISFRFTPHYFFEEDELFRRTFARDCRFPATLEEEWPEDWPPAFLWDFIYGVIIAQKYGIPDTVKDLRDDDAYYPDGIKTTVERNLVDLAHAKHEHDQKIADQNRERSQRTNNRDRGQQDCMDAFDIVFALWTRPRFGRFGEEARAQKEAEMIEMEKTVQKAKAKEVTKWQQEVAEACDPRFYASQSQTSTSTPSSPSCPSSPSLLIQDSLEKLDLAFGSLA